MGPLPSGSSTREANPGWYNLQGLITPSKGAEASVQEFYFGGTELGTQMFLQLAVLAEQLLEGIRVLNAGRGLTKHLLEPTHSAEEETEAKRAVRWHTQLVAEGQCPGNKFCIL